MLQKTSGQTLTEYLQTSALFDEAFACLRREEHQKAISLFQQVLVLNPDHVQSYGNMALAHSALGEQKIALQYLDKALSLDPTYEPAQQNRENISRLREGEKSPFIKDCLDPDRKIPDLCMEVVNDLLLLSDKTESSFSLSPEQERIMKLVYEEVEIAIQEGNPDVHLHEINTKAIPQLKVHGGFMREKFIEQIIRGRNQAQMIANDKKQHRLL
ncbi:MAG TPA: tetratricopeptide repeat protein [Waddliaceae bacterium]